MLVVGGISLPETWALSKLSNVFGFGFFIAWYMMSGKDQKEVVYYRYGTSYIKRGWTMPVLLALGAYLGLFLVAVAVAVGSLYIAGR